MGERPLNLLLVEDEGLLAMTLADMIEALGHKVVGAAADVRRALDLVAEHDGGLDGCILDANLDGDSAAPVADALRTAGVPVLLASSYDREDLARLGFGEPTLRKPYSRVALAAALARLAG